MIVKGKDENLEIDRRSINALHIPIEIDPEREKERE